MSLYHLHARLFEGVLADPDARYEFQSRETDCSFFGPLLTDVPGVQRTTFDRSSSVNCNSRRPPRCGLPAPLHRLQYGLLSAQQRHAIDQLQPTPAGRPPTRS